MHEVTTVEELDALPDHTILRTARGYPTEIVSDRWSGNRCLSSTIETGGDGWWSLATGVAKMAPLTVLFRPDAPQPDTTGNSAFPVADDAVERAAHPGVLPSAEGLTAALRWLAEQEGVREDWYAEEVPAIMAALATAGAGAEADRLSQVHADALATLDSVADHMDEFAYEELHSAMEDGVLLRDDDGTAKHQGHVRTAGEAVYREALRCEVDPGCIVAHSVNCREQNGTDREHLDDFLAARGDAPSPVVDREALARSIVSAYRAVMEDRQGLDVQYARDMADHLIARGALAARIEAGDPT